MDCSEGGIRILEALAPRLDARDHESQIRTTRRIERLQDYLHVSDQMYQKLPMLIDQVDSTSNLVSCRARHGSKGCGHGRNRAL